MPSSGTHPLARPLSSWLDAADLAADDLLHVSRLVLGARSVEEWCKEIGLKIQDLGPPLGRTLQTCKRFKFLEPIFDEDPLILWPSMETESIEMISDLPSTPSIDGKEFCDILQMGTAYRKLQSYSSDYREETLAGIRNMCFDESQRMPTEERLVSLLQMASSFDDPRLLPFKLSCNIGQSPTPNAKVISLVDLTLRVWSNCHQVADSDGVLNRAKSALAVSRRKGLEDQPEDPALAIDFLNADMTALYDISSKMEHSCTPNVLVGVSNIRIRVIAARDIDPSERLTSFYDGSSSDLVLMPDLIRQAKLRTLFGFLCACPRCAAKNDLTRTLQCPACQQYIAAFPSNAGWNSSNPERNFVMCDQCGETSSAAHSPKVQAYLDLEIAILTRLVGGTDQQSTPNSEWDYVANFLKEHGLLNEAERPVETVVESFNEENDRHDEGFWTLVEVDDFHDRLQTLAVPSSNYLYSLIHAQLDPEDTPWSSFLLRIITMEWFEAHAAHQMKPQRGCTSRRRCRSLDESKAIDVAETSPLPPPFTTLDRLNTPWGSNQGHSSFNVIEQVKKWNAKGSRKLHWPPRTPSVRVGVLVMLLSAALDDDKEDKFNQVNWRPRLSASDKAAIADAIEERYGEVTELWEDCLL